MSENRAVRYRKLALAEQDPAAAKLLRQIADEAERGVLCVVERRLTHSSAPAAVAVPKA
jgi:hypothetical protein